jgi:hydrogenase nickel incorporation protein HypA/HybF
VHELSVCQALIGQVLGTARERGACRVRGIVLRIGPLSGVEPQLLRRAYSIAIAGTAAEEAELALEEAPVTVRCLKCQAEGEASSSDLSCRKCGYWRTQLLSGDELLLASIELERDAKVEEHV